MSQMEICHSLCTRCQPRDKETLQGLFFPLPDGICSDNGDAEPLGCAVRARVDAAVGNRSNIHPWTHSVVTRSVTCSWLALTSHTQQVRETRLCYIK